MRGVWPRGAMCERNLRNSPAGKIPGAIFLAVALYIGKGGDMPRNHASATRQLGNLRPLINDGYLTNLKVSIRKIWMGLFSNYFEKRGLFSKYFEKIPPPPGAAAPGGRRRRRHQGYFSKIFGKQTLLFQNIWKKGPSIFF